MECLNCRDLDLTESYCQLYQEDPDLDEFWAPLEEQPWPDGTYRGLNSWGHHVFTPVEEQQYRLDDGIRVCPYGQKGDLVRARNAPVQFIIELVAALQPVVVTPALLAIESPELSEAMQLERPWFWRIKYKRISL